PHPPGSILFPYTTLFRSRLVALVSHINGSVGRDCGGRALVEWMGAVAHRDRARPAGAVIVRHGFYDLGRNVSTLSAIELEEGPRDRKSTRLNSSHVAISY